MFNEKGHCFDLTKEDKIYFVLKNDKPLPCVLVMHSWFCMLLIVKKKINSKLEQFLTREFQTDK